MKEVLECLFKNKRGLSPVISSVLLATAVIAIGLSVVVWSNSAFSARQSGASAFLSSRSESLKESFVIEDVWFYQGSPRYVDVTVRNVGTIDLEVVAIYMNGTTVWEGSQVIDVGETATIKVTFAWQSGEYRIVVATARGNQVREWHSTSG